MNQPMFTKFVQHIRRVAYSFCYFYQASGCIFNKLRHDRGGNKQENIINCQIIQTSIKSSKSRNPVLQEPIRTKERPDDPRTEVEYTILELPPWKVKDIQMEVSYICWPQLKVQPSKEHEKRETTNFSLLTLAISTHKFNKNSSEEQSLSFWTKNTLR